MQKKFNLHQLIHPSSLFNQQTDLCYICFDIKVQPVQCETCKSSYCKYCADTWKKNKNSCPNRCSEVWKYNLTTPLETKLRCPNECDVLITPNEFVSHIKMSCEKREFDIGNFKKQYKCDRGHQLQYVSNQFNVSFNQQCASCFATKTLCRSTCKQCKNNGEKLYNYCASCRFPKGFTKTCCPIGHNNLFIKSTAMSLTTYCDICSMKVVKNGKGCVEDKECDFAICYKCYVGLEDGPGQKLDFQGYQEQQPQVELNQEENWDNQQYLSLDNNGLMAALNQLLSAILPDNPNISLINQHFSSQFHNLIHPDNVAINALEDNANIDDQGNHEGNQEQGQIDEISVGNDIQIEDSNEILEFDCGDGQGDGQGEGDEDEDNSQ